MLQFLALIFNHKEQHESQERLRIAMNIRRLIADVWWASQCVCFGNTCHIFDATGKFVVKSPRNWTHSQKSVELNTFSKPSFKVLKKYLFCSSVYNSKVSLGTVDTLRFVCRTRCSQDKLVNIKIEKASLLFSSTSFAQGWLKNGANRGVFAVEPVDCAVLGKRKYV